MSSESGRRSISISRNKSCAALSECLTLAGRTEISRRPNNALLAPINRVPPQRVSTNVKYHRELEVPWKWFNDVEEQRVSRKACNCGSLCLAALEQTESCNVYGKRLVVHQRAVVDIDTVGQGLR